MAKKLKIAIAISPDLLKRADKHAAGLRMSRSAFIEAALQDSMEDTEQFATAMGNSAVRNSFLSALQEPGVLKGLAEAMGAKLSPLDLASAKDMLGSMNSKEGTQGGKRGRKRGK